VGVLANEDIRIDKPTKLLNQARLECLRLMGKLKMKLLLRSLRD
jgi:hypothetical protein